MKAAKVMTDDGFQVAAPWRRIDIVRTVAYVHAFGQRDPVATRKIHLGATSCYGRVEEISSS